MHTPLPEMKPSLYSLLEFVYLTGQCRHSLEVHPLPPPTKKNPGSAPEFCQNLEDGDKSYRTFPRKFLEIFSENVNYCYSTDNSRTCFKWEYNC